MTREPPSRLPPPRSGEIPPLGALELQHHDGTEARSVLAQTKRFALLVYLAVASPRGFHRRDTLLGIFWPELDEDRARSALSQALYYLRQSLGPDVVVSRGKDEVGVGPQDRWCDVAALQDGLDAGGPERIRDALELYRGDFLPGFFLSDAPEFEHWLEEERARLRGRIASATWALADAAEAAGHPAEAVSWGRKALATGGPDEGRLRRLIEMLDRAGDRASAVRLYEEVAERLEREWEIEPAPETQRLIEEIRRRVEPVVDDRLRDGDAGARHPVAAWSDRISILSPMAPSRRRSPRPPLPVGPDALSSWAESRRGWRLS